MAYTYKPNERYALVGKTRSGKTTQAEVLAGTFAVALWQTDWEVWVLDTKGDPNDLIAWRKWGFRNVASTQDQRTSLLRNALYFRIDSKDPQGRDLSVVTQCQSIITAAYSRGNVILVLDEYVSVVESRQEPGKPLKDAFQRGGGRNVGVIGCTQEPVYVPRQLLSQATHIFLFTLTYDYDIQWAKKICKTYEPPSTRGDIHGFWYKWVDGPTNKWAYYASQMDWYESLKIALPKPVDLPQPALENF